MTEPNAEQRIDLALTRYEQLLERLHDLPENEMGTSQLYPFAIQSWTLAALLVILHRQNPDLADIAGEWVQAALEDGETASEVTHFWREQTHAVTREPLWLPEMILERLT